VGRQVDNELALPEIFTSGKRPAGRVLPSYKLLSRCTEIGSSALSEQIKAEASSYQ
jgi:hypothetical protein